VTGSGGFIGRHFAALIHTKSLGGLEFTWWNQERDGSFLSTLDRRSALEQLDPTTVIHLAWASTAASNYQSLPENAEWAVATRDFIDECVQREIWLVGTGSAVDDADASGESTPYMQAKKMLRMYADELIQGQARLTWLRPQYVVSIVDARPSVIRSFVQAHDPSRFQPRNPGDALDFIEVRDVASGILTVICSEIFGNVYLGSGSLHTVSQLLSAVSPSGYESTSVAGDYRAISARESPAALQAHGWAPVYTEWLFHSEVH